jgi:hypothetical protein
MARVVRQALGIAVRGDAPLVIRGGPRERLLEERP